MTWTLERHACASIMASPMRFWRHRACFGTFFLCLLRLVFTLFARFQWLAVTEISLSVLTFLSYILPMLIPYPSPWWVTPGGMGGGRKLSFRVDHSRWRDLRKGTVLQWFIFQWTPIIHIFNWAPYIFEVAAFRPFLFSLQWDPRWI